MDNDICLFNHLALKIFLLELSSNPIYNPCVEFFNSYKPILNRIKGDNKNDA